MHLEDTFVSPLDWQNCFGTNTVVSMFLICALWPFFESPISNPQHSTHHWQKFKIWGVNVKQVFDFHQKSNQKLIKKKVNCLIMMIFPSMWFEHILLSLWAWEMQNCHPSWHTKDIYTWGRHLDRTVPAACLQFYRVFKECLHLPLH